MNTKKNINDLLTKHLNAVNSLTTVDINNINTIINKIVSCFRDGNKVLIFGNGGSASDAEHFAAELSGRFKMSRSPLPAIALTCNSSVITAIGNDYGFEAVFARQIEGLVEEGDVVIGISTSGNSSNVNYGLNMAKSFGATTIGLIGKSGGEQSKVCDIAVVVNSQDTATIQEIHILIIHIICEILEKELFRDDEQ